MSRLDGKVGEDKESEDTHLLIRKCSLKGMKKKKKKRLFTVAHFKPRFIKLRQKAYLES